MVRTKQTAVKSIKKVPNLGGKTIRKPIPTLGPYYRKQGGIIDKQKIQKYKEFIKK